MELFGKGVVTMPAPVVTHRFADRRAAGRALAWALSHYADRPALQILALPRGGVPVAYEVAQALSAPLDVLLVRKLGVPGQVELAMGAIAEHGVRVLNDDIIAELGIRPHVIEEVTALEQAEIARRARAYRGQRPPPVLRDKTVIIIDDGLATGATMRGAVDCVRLQQPRWVAVAVPVASKEGAWLLRTVADDVIAVMTVEPFYALSYWYDDFRQTSDDEVRQLLQASLPASAAPGDEDA
ncbi:phosphoribosyltransferase [Chloroflexus sp.]|uniref:phosphoribosyltransferase n=1 Tax=Chloroflexus sp. TaxID=1904827 RepID=UPI00260E0475|nr:phosphoribosyltransferase [uncultured Chloroflexus sp.]